MGADLYIRSLSEPAKAKYEPLFMKAVKVRDSLPQDEAHAIERAKAQEKVSKYYDLMYSKGYYRDSYNVTSVMWRMDLSWWQDVGKMLNKKGELCPSKAKRLLKLIQSREVQPMTAEEIKEKHGTVDDGDNSPEKWLECWQKQRLELIKFLQTAILKKESIRCSI